LKGERGGARVETENEKPPTLRKDGEEWGTRKSEEERMLPVAEE
jgi:hypothetical protein